MADDAFGSEEKPLSRIQFCPITHMQLTPSGWCDDCEEFHSRTPVRQ